MGVRLGFSQWGKNINWVLENRVLRRIVGTREDEITGG
jgi:hypothetical protein